MSLNGNNDAIHQVLLGNVFDHIISKYLNSKDILHLGLSNRKLRSKLNLLYIHPQVKKRVSERLKTIFGEYYEEFVNDMIITKGIISGSFIIQCVLNEFWDNSDIDIYVENNNVFQSVHQRPAYDYYASDAENHFNSVGSGNSLIFHRLFNDKSKRVYCGNYKTFGNHIEGIVNYELHNNCKIQVINVNTSDKYTLRDHNKNTGFDICKNILQFNKDKSMHLEFKNLKDIIYRRTLFSILEIDDFYYRIEKYSKRGFFFKPKFNKGLYLEYIMLRFNGYHALKTNFNENTYFKLKEKQRQFEKNRSPDEASYYDPLPPFNCGVNCPVKLLFRDVRHYHYVWHDINGQYYDYKVIIVENIDGMFDKIIPQLEKCDHDRGMNRICFKCKNTDEWVKFRTTKSDVSIQLLSKKYAKDISSYKFDIQYGLPCNPRISIKKKKKRNKKKYKETKGGWIQVSRRGK